MNYQDQITLSMIFKTVLSKVSLILKLALIFQVPLILWIFLLQKDTYVSSAVIKIEDANQSQLSKGLDLVALSGINVKEDGAVVDIHEIANSLDFFIYFLDQTDIPVQIVAAVPDGKDSWKIDTDIYDEKSKEWIRDVKYPLSKNPSYLELYEIFYEYFSISLDPRTDYLKIKVTHFSPEITYYWNKTFIDKLIEYTRNKDSERSKAILDSYTKELSKTQNTSITYDLNEIIINNYLNNIIAAALPNYKFDILRKPYRPEFKENNEIVSIIVFSFIIYILISVVVFFRYSPLKAID